MHPLAIDFYGLSEVHIALLISGVALIYAIRRWRRNSVSHNRAIESPASDSHVGSPLNVREVATELQAILADLEETSRRLTAQLDNRYTRLEQLLAEADEKIHKLEQLTQPPGTQAVASPATAPVPQGVLTDAQRTLARLRTERGAPPAERDPAYLPIYTLADRGKSSREIAQELGRQPGEIELILALRRD
jgi:hypothetical protein